MALFFLHGLILLGLSMAIMSKIFVSGTELANPSLITKRHIPVKRCRYYRDKNMITSNCQNLYLENIPSILGSKIEVLDVSFNRLTSLEQGSFSRLRSLKYLHLHDNFLMNIDEMAFDPLQNLIVLDLSKTRCPTLPKSLFTLPQLEKLNLGDNKLNETVFNTTVKSPLTTIHAPNNQFQKLPNLGPFPALMYLNVSGNMISRISVDDIAPYCKLDVLDVSKNPITFDTSTCDCQNFKAWTNEHNITVSPEFSCSDNSQLNCPSNFNNTTMSLFNACEEIYRIQIENEKATFKWILITGCSIGLLICVFAIFKNLL